MTSGLSLGARATMLAGQGRVQDALVVLNQAAARNDPEALLEVAVWQLSGEFIPRDLAASREFFRRAAAAGHPGGLRIYNNFLANGTGGPADWNKATELLRRRAAHDHEAAEQGEVIAAMRLTPDGSPATVPTGQRLSASPHVELFRKAFSPTECDFLARAAVPLMEAALTVHPQTGQQVAHPIRTSDAASFPLALENPAIHALNRRMASLSRTHVTQGEPLQVLRYLPGQQYRAHSDALPGAVNQRILTVLVYLTDQFAGGETHFLANHLSVRGEIGDALLFRNVTADGLPDPRATHAGLPVTSGVKMIASRWIRATPLSLAAARG